MLDKFLKKRYFYSVYIGVLFTLAVLVVITGQQVWGAVLFGCIAAACLVLFSSLMPFIIPVLLLSVFVTVCYNSFDTFIKFIPLVFPLVFCIGFSLVKYKVKLRRGPSFRGIVAVAVAVTLGGTGTLHPRDYFSPTSLFYVFMLGGGMVLLYLLFFSRLRRSDAPVMAMTMYAVGLLAAFIIFFHYYQNWDVFVSGRKFLGLQAANNLCTFMMLALPFPMYYARRRYADVLVVFVIYLAMLLSSSRGGLVMGTLEILILLLIFAFAYEDRLQVKVIYIAFMAVGAVLAYKYLPELILKTSNRSLMFAPDEPVFSQLGELFQHYFWSKKEPRIELLKRSVTDFATNPIFGVGIGYKGNSDLYSPKVGAMNWYHMWVPQVAGGLGIVGILAYGYQLISRTVIFYKHRSPLNLTLFASYMGLWLMSQVNPGEFCPIPYALIAVIYFILIERKKNETRKTHPIIQGLRMGRNEAAPTVPQGAGGRCDCRELGGELSSRRRDTADGRTDTEGVRSPRSRGSGDRKAVRRIPHTH